MLKLISLLNLVAVVVSKNPIIPNQGQADPHIHIYNNNFYLYSTHDFSSNNTNFIMKNWWIWSSPNLVDWSLSSIVYPNQTSTPANQYDSCWATDSASIVTPFGTQYFFYLSYGPDQVGVLNSSSPTGPWEDFLKAPLLNTSLGNSLNPKATFRDPAVLQDDDGSYYIISGVFDYYITRLDSTLMGLAETPRYVTIVNPQGPYGNSTDDKPYLHKRNGLYYLSWGCFYAMSTNVYGPYYYIGNVISTSEISPDFRMPSQDFDDRHGNFFEYFNQSYFISNDRSHSSDTAHPEFFRDSVIGYVHYYENETIAFVQINGTGVGEYDVAHPIEAENYFALVNAFGGNERARKMHMSSLNRFGVFVSDGSMISYPFVRLSSKDEQSVEVSRITFSGMFLDSMSNNVTLTVLSASTYFQGFDEEDYTSLAEVCTVTIYQSESTKDETEKVCKFQSPKKISHSTPMHLIVNVSFGTYWIDNFQVI
jgi:arabinoxylan arabinofuranohydrolase